MIGVLALVLGVPTTPCEARSLRAAFVSAFPTPLDADGRGLAEVFTRSVAASFPITGTSASYLFRFDPESLSYDRLDIPLGPVFSERASTLGKGKLSLGVNYLYLDYDHIDGYNLDRLVSNDPQSGKDFIALPDFTRVLGVVDVDLEAQIVAFAATYGVTPRLDVNIQLPLVRTALDSSTTFVVPDPRTGNSGGPEETFGGHGSETATGVGDLLLRAKYVLTSNPYVDVAAGFLLSLPTGDENDFHGTGDTVLGPALYASRVFLQRIEPHLNLGFAIDANEVNRSQARYSAGVDVRVLDWLTLNNDFIGTSDLATADQIDRPVFVQIERNDVLRFSTGFKLQFYTSRGFLLRRVAGFFNVLLPLNEDGLQANQILAAGLQMVF